MRAGEILMIDFKGSKNGYASDHKKKVIAEPVNDNHQNQQHFDGPDQLSRRTLLTKSALSFAGNLKRQVAGSVVR